MEKMRMESPDITAQNVDKIAALFPNCITETADAKGKLRKAIDFDKLRQMLSNDIAEGSESYEFTWVGKKAAMVEANTPIRKTLRPCPEESKDWDNTQNLYIEGDNLDALKLLQESYLGKVKMIYIDPPYNTGSDRFIYPDNYIMDEKEYEEGIGLYDEEGNRLYKENNASNPRFHSDWCSMMYSRLLLARNLLSEDGVIFISIDDNEQSNLKKICDEVFGVDSCLGIVSNTNNPKGRSDDKYIATAHEYLLVYAKNILKVKWNGFEPTDEITRRYNKLDEQQRKYREIDLRKTGENDLREDRPNLFYYFYYSAKSGDFFPDRENYVKEGYIQIKPQREDGREGNWRWGIDTAKEKLSELVPKFMPSRKIWGVMQKDYLEGRALVKPTTSWTFKDVNSERGTEAFIELGFDKRVFPKPKPVGTIKRCAILSANPNDIVLDFFSGSSTTAHAVMKLNAEDGGNRKFIMVQLPDPCAEGTEAAKAGYANICEIGKERIRRAGAKIKEEAGLLGDKLDTGFRVLKVADSNMKPVYYEPDKLAQGSLLDLESNIKEDRTALDLLFGCLLEWGVPLDKDYHSEVIDGFTVHFYQGANYVACFDSNVSETLIEEIASRNPEHILFRDSCFASAPAKMNMFEICKRLMPAKAADIRRIVTVL